METFIYINSYEKPFLVIDNVKIELNCTYDGEHRAQRKMRVIKGQQSNILAVNIANTFLVPVDSDFVKCIMEVVNNYL